MLDLSQCAKGQGLDALRTSSRVCDFVLTKRFWSCDFAFGAVCSKNLGLMNEGLNQ